VISHTHTQGVGCAKGSENELKGPKGGVFIGLSPLKVRMSLLLDNSAKHQTFALFCQTFDVWYYPAVLGQIEHSVVPARMFGVPFDCLNRDIRQTLECS
jgi:hypothetical protein